MENQAILVLSTKSLILRETGHENEEIMDPSNDIKFFKTSDDGKLVAWSKSKSVDLMCLYDRKIKTKLEISRSQLLGFSPNSTYFWVWNTPSDFTTLNYEDNFKIFKTTLNDTIEMKEVYSSKIGSCFQCELYWIDDENAIQLGSKYIRFYKSGVFDRQINISGLIESSCSQFYSCFFIESNDQNIPSFARLYKNSNLMANPLASVPIKDKKDFKFYWNSKGNSVIIACLDKVEQRSSYYGNKKVFFLRSTGEAFQIDLGDDRSAYHISWFPKSDKFAIIHGGNPLTLALYNHVGDQIKKVTTGNFNYFSINPFENLLCLCGIGDIKSHVEFWSLESYKIISYVDTPISNDVFWMPDGQNLVFISTSPRIVIENGYRIYNYMGSKIHQFIPSLQDSVNDNIIQIQAITNKEVVDFLPPKIQIPSEPIDNRAKKSEVYVAPKSKTNIFSNESNDASANTKKGRRKNKKSQTINA